jgi:peptide deformylase
MLADEMLAFMRQEKGIGLAAPQIGRSTRVFVMEVYGRVRCCFNPEILSSSDILSDFDEGCLSFPGGSCTIKRPDAVKVRYQDAHGSCIEEELQGLAARCFQHELDHLNGITMYDRQKEQHAEQS